MPFFAVFLLAGAALAVVFTVAAIGSEILHSPWFPALIVMAVVLFVRPKRRAPGVDNGEPYFVFHPRKGFMREKHAETDAPAEDGTKEP